MTTPVDASMMNPVELFMTADWVVKSVMVGLAAASIWSWTIIIDKAFRFTALNRQADQQSRRKQHACTHHRLLCARNARENGCAGL